MKSLTWAANMRLQPWKQAITQHQKWRGQQIKGGDCTPLLYTFEAPLDLLHPGIGPPEQGRCRAVAAGPEVGHEDDPLECLSFEEFGTFSLQKRILWGDLISVFHYLRGT